MPESSPNELLSAPNMATGDRWKGLKDTLGFRYVLRVSRSLSLIVWSTLMAKLLLLPVELPCAR
jgi:hypothetical protein